MDGPWESLQQFVQRRPFLIAGAVAGAALPLFDLVAGAPGLAAIDAATLALIVRIAVTWKPRSREQLPVWRSAAIGTVRVRRRFFLSEAAWALIGCGAAEVLLALPHPPTWRVALGGGVLLFGLGRAWARLRDFAVRELRAEPEGLRVEFDYWSLLLAWSNVTAVRASPDRSEVLFNLLDHEALRSSVLGSSRESEYLRIQLARLQDTPAADLALPITGLTADADEVASLVEQLRENATEAAPDVPRALIRSRLTK